MRFLFIQTDLNLIKIVCPGWNFSPDLRILHGLPVETSIFTVEAWAIVLAVNAIADFNCSTRAVIFSDSKSVLDAFASPLPNNKNYLIHRIKNNLNAIRDGREINLF